MLHTPATIAFVAERLATNPRQAALLAEGASL